MISYGNKNSEDSVALSIIVITITVTKMLEMATKICRRLEKEVIK